MPRISRLALVLVAVLTLAACGGKKPQTSIEPSESLPAVHAQQGQTVYVQVKGGTDSLNEDLQSMLTAYLQSERGLSPVDTQKEARIVVAVNLGDRVALGSSDKPVSGTQALGGTAMGAGLGALLGSAFGGSGRGTGVGAGVGALLGLGVVWMDSLGKNSAWAMRARVGINTEGKMPAADSMRALVVTAEGDRMGEKEILPGLEDALCQKIVGAFSQ